MPRYYTRPKSYWQEIPAPDPHATMTVFCSDSEHMDSGLLNENGEQLYKRSMQPIGFLAKHDE